MVSGGTQTKKEKIKRNQQQIAVRRAEGKYLCENALEKWKK